MIKKYTVSKGTNDGNLAFACQLSCNGKHVQWFSDESIARKTCDELTSIELIKENTKVETVTEFADRCRECGAKYGKLLKQEPCEDCDYSEIMDWEQDAKTGKAKPIYWCEKHKEPCDECRNKRTSFCGNCKEYDEFEPQERSDKK